jgi:hypothetical protein
MNNFDSDMLKKLEKIDLNTLSKNNSPDKKLTTLTTSKKLSETDEKKPNNESDKKRRNNKI